MLFTITFINQEYSQYDSGKSQARIYSERFTQYKITQYHCNQWVDICIYSADANGQLGKHIHVSTISEHRAKYDEVAKRQERIWIPKFKACEVINKWAAY